MIAQIRLQEDQVAKIEWRMRQTEELKAKVTSVRRIKLKKSIYLQPEDNTGQEESKESPGVFSGFSQNQS